MPSRAVSGQNTNLMLPRYNLDFLLEFVLWYQAAHLSYNNYFQCAYLDLIHSFLGLSSPEKIISNSAGRTHRCWEPITIVKATITGTHRSREIWYCDLRRHNPHPSWCWFLVTLCGGCPTDRQR